MMVVILIKYSTLAGGRSYYDLNDGYTVFGFFARLKPNVNILDAQLILIEHGLN